MVEPFLPKPMPHCAQEYARKYSLTHFINTYYEIRDALSFDPKRILIIGVGVGLEPIVLREKFNIEVTTLDIDKDFNPDVVGSVHDMRVFPNKAFDVAIISHVLEHLPYSFFDPALRELARVANASVVFLPYGGRNLSIRFIFAQRIRELVFNVHIPPRKRISGNEPVLCDGEHYWEVGFRGFSKKTILEDFSKHFEVINHYHNYDWMYSMNFILKSRNSDTGCAQ